MSKKYDEYVSQFANQPDRVYLQSHLDPEFRRLDPELSQEIRDRAIIDFVKMADKVGLDVSYGDVLKAIDKNLAEKEYEALKAQQEQNKTSHY